MHYYALTNLGLNCGFKKHQLSPAVAFLSTRQAFSTSSLQSFHFPIPTAGCHPLLLIQTESLKSSLNWYCRPDESSSKRKP